MGRRLTGHAIAGPSKRIRLRRKIAPMRGRVGDGTRFPRGWWATPKERRAHYYDGSALSLCGTTRVPMLVLERACVEALDRCPPSWLRICVACGRAHLSK